MKLNHRDLEFLYASAYHCYKQGNYPKACELFTALVMHDPFQTRFWKGLAATKQMQKEYKAALHAWGTLALLDGHKPDTHFHAAECLISTEEKEEALKALTLAENQLKNASALNEKIAYLKKELAHAS